VVKLPGPAIKGKAIGNTEALRASSSSLYKVIPKIISKAIKNKIKEPATAKEFTSTPIKLNNRSPTNKNTIIINPAITDAFSDCICPAFFLKSIIIGTLPIISITANNTINVVNISFKLKFIIFFVFGCKIIEVKETIYYFCKIKISKLCFS